MDLYKKLLDDPLFSPLHQEAWQATYLLEESGFFTHRKAAYIRNTHLTTATVDGKFIDLKNPDHPRQSVIKANARLDEETWRFLQEIGNPSHIYNGKLPSRIWNRPEMAPLISMFPNMDLTDYLIMIYGEDGGSSFFMGDLKTIAVSPDYFGLPFMLCEVVSIIHPIGLNINNMIGYDLIYGCCDLIAQENHIDFYGITCFLKNLLVNASCDELRELAKEFILGNCSPLFESLRKVNPLAPGLLIFISRLSSAHATPNSIARLKVIRALHV